MLTIPIHNAHIDISECPGRVAATACTYLRRFYLVKDLCEYDPRLVGPACVYLACKTEESQVQAKVLYHFLRKISSTGKPYSCLPLQTVQIAAS